jgi:DNA-binding transcriptional MerR regulator
MEEEYVTIAQAARKLGDVSDKTIRRAIHSGKLAARYPQPNKAEVSIADLQEWYDSRSVRPGETQERLTALEARVAELEAQVLSLRKQLETKKKEPPKPATTAPDGFTYLSDFCTQHFVPYQAAASLFPHMIRGQYLTVQRRKQAVIGPKGRHDFWVQLHTRPDFRSCDDCPHEENGQSV